MSSPASTPPRQGSPRSGEAAEDAPRPRTAPPDNFCDRTSAQQVTVLSKRARTTSIPPSNRICASSQPLPFFRTLPANAAAQSHWTPAHAQASACSLPKPRRRARRAVVETLQFVSSMRSIVTSAPETGVQSATFGESDRAAHTA
eukprot:scaffold90721_cov30-Tisochrysis_lutea.AAC.2